MDDLFDAVLDFFAELFIWEQLNEDLRKKIPNRFLRWIVTTLIYLLIVMALLLLLKGIYLLIRKFF